MNDTTECPFCYEGEECNECDSTGVMFWRDIYKRERELRAEANYEPRHG